MKYLIPLTVIVLLIFTSCKQEKQDAEENPEVKTTTDFDPQDAMDSGIATIDDFQSWWRYHYYDIDLYGNFVPLNQDSVFIKKGNFLKQIVDNEVLPIQVKSDNGANFYKLYSVAGDAKESALSAVKNQARSALQFYEMEDTKFPYVDFTTLEGNIYTTESLRGKFVVYKTWFINCVPCIKEFPDLNEFVEEYKDDNVVFISLATDDADSLAAFLTTKDFNYQTVAGQETLIQDQLGFNVYPTHVLVKPNGKIFKVFPSAEKLMKFIENNKGFKLPLPPPPPPAPQILDVSVKD